MSIFAMNSPADGANRPRVCLIGQADHPRRAADRRFHQLYIGQSRNVAAAHARIVRIRLDGNNPRQWKCPRKPYRAGADIGADSGCVGGLKPTLRLRPTMQFQ